MNENFVHNFSLSGQTIHKTEKEKNMNKNYVSLEGAASHYDIISRMQGELKKGNYGKDHWLVGKGFDECTLAEKTSPEAYVLNEISDSVPVVIMDKTGNTACANTAALSLVNVSHNKGVVDKKSIETLKNSIK